MNLPLIKVVGISASGKSTLVKGLRRACYNTRPVSQEHSHVADLWQQFDRPAVLIYLDIDLAAQRRRRPDVSWDEANLAIEQTRLAHAREHADLRLNTGQLEAAAVLQLVVAFLQSQRIRRADQPLPALGATGSANPPEAESEPAAKVASPGKRKKKKRRKASDAEA